MLRREFIAGLGSAAAWPVTAQAQQSGMPVIGFLGNEPLDADRLRGFRQGLSETGFVEGRNVLIEYRWAGPQVDRLPTLADDLVRREVAVIATSGGAVPALAAKAATTTIPIVFSTAVDPVSRGLVVSLNRPGGNLTGVTTLGTELMPKALGLLHEAVPAATIIALLVNPTYPVVVEPLLREMQAPAQALGLHLHVLHASTEREFDAVFLTLVKLQAGGLVISGNPFFANRMKLLAALALRHAVPTIASVPQFASAGGLMGYGGSGLDSYRLVGTYTGRILKGEKPADLPVQQATKIDLVINLNTAKALGLTILETLLATADEVIQ